MNKIFMVVVLTWLIISISSCRDEKPENLQERIKKNWGLTATGFVKKDGVDVTSEYAGLSMMFKNDETYLVLNGKKLFSPQGTWRWVGTDLTKLIMDDDFPVTVVELTPSTLIIHFKMTESDVNINGRATAVVGNYELSLQAL